MKKKTISKVMAILLVSLILIATVVPTTLAAKDPSLYTGNSSINK